MAVLVDDLVTAVRDQIDESNPEDISPASVLRALNRARLKLIRLSSRKFSPMFRKAETETMDGTTRELSIPAMAFGLVVNEVAVIQSGQAFLVDPALERDISAFDSAQSSSALPLYYTQQGNTLQLFPKPISGTQIRVRFQQRAPELVAQQGRITTIDSANNRVYVDAIGTDLTTSIAQLGAFVNWINAATGEVRTTLQVSEIDTANLRITFKSTGLDRTTVYGLPVTAALPVAGAQDDYLCLAQGTCVPTLIEDYADYMVQFAVVELKRKADMPLQDDITALRELEEDIRSMWSGRQPGRRVRRTSGYWGSPSSLLARYRT